MCGISGILSFAGKAPERFELERMNARLHHRGPDGSGIFLDGPVGLPTRGRIAGELDENFAGIEMSVSQTFARPCDQTRC